MKNLSLTAEELFLQENSLLQDYESADHYVSDSLYSIPSYDVTFENDIQYVFELAKNVQLPSILQTKTIPVYDTEYNQITSIYMHNGPLKGFIETKLQGFLPITLATGAAGTGKTTSMTEFAKTVHRKYWDLNLKMVSPEGTFYFRDVQDKEWNMDRCFLIGRNEFLLAEQVKDRFVKGDIIFVDEVQQAFNRYRSMSNQNKEFNNFFETCRKFNLGGFIGTAVRFDSVDIQFTNGTVQEWLNFFEKVDKWKKSHAYQNIRMDYADGKTTGKYQPWKKSWFRWTPKKDYDKTAALAETNIMSTEGLAKKDINEVKKELTKEAKKREVMIKISDIVLNTTSTVETKAVDLLKLGLNPHYVTEIIHKKCGFTSLKETRVKQLKKDLKVTELIDDLPDINR